ncbi:hypothetical protein DTL21_09355 [Bremerella cremea]|uniref:Uncharacterized protein n=1 Tax=Blastopirellula marina TaxID=124 RepID=A0A2S8FVA7_9BACT|nr:MULTISPECIES: hypothetical protein [Pirellulaceae]PQO36115.1 hypothetical protein C5Y83_09350 [Blastopirellula marina]RCS48792.1 hypothetical protein DTL21_09355 [Bremerella cremea]
MMFCRDRSCVHVIVLLSLTLGLPGTVLGSGRAELVLTYGKSGLPRSNVFHSGEKIFATLRLTGLQDQRPYTGQIEVTGSVIDANGKEVLRVAKERENYQQVLGGDSVETTLVIDSDGEEIPPGEYSLFARVKHLRTGQHFDVRHGFTWKAIEKFGTDEFCWFLDLERNYPSGPLLQTGRLHVLAYRNVGMTFNDRSFGIEKQMKLLRPSEQVAIGQTAVFENLRTVPGGGKLPERAWSGTGLKFSSSGDFKISVEFKDMLSGSTALDTIPVKVAETDAVSKSKSLMFLTNGAYGPRKQMDYFAGEDVTATLAFEDPGKGSISKQVLSAHFLDEDEKTIGKFPLGNLDALSGFAESYFVEHVSIPGNRFVSSLEKVRDVRIQLEGQSDGRKTILSAPIRFQPIRALAALNVSVKADAQGKIPAGQFLTAGQIYYLNCDLAKFQIKDYAINLTHSVKAFTEQDQPIAGTELVLEHKRELSVSEKLNGNLPVSMQISLNRPGKFLLRSTFTDHLSGQTFTSVLPVEVVSPFQFYKKN